MPEGHTIHRAARDHAQDLCGKPLRLSSPQGRFDAAAIAGPKSEATLLRVEAFGKHLFYHFAEDRIVHVHLGLFGKFRRRRSPAPTLAHVAESRSPASCPARRATGAPGRNVVAAHRRVGARPPSA